MWAERRNSGLADPWSCHTLRLAAGGSLREITDPFSQLKKTPTFSRTYELVTVVSVESGDHPFDDPQRLHQQVDASGRRNAGAHNVGSGLG